MVTTFVIQVLALLHISLGIAALRGIVNYSKLVKELTEPGMAIMIGLISLPIGLYLVTYHNIWVKDWEVIVTIVGWSALIKGFLYIAYPDKLVKMTKGMFKKTQSFGYVLLAIGLALAHVGFNVL